LKISTPSLGPEQTLTESGIIIQFLADFEQSTLLPPSNTPQGALFRARLNFFNDTWSTKVGSYMFSLFRAQSDAEKEKTSQEWVATVKKEIEPLLADAKPFFGGSNKLTLAEVSDIRSGKRGTVTEWTSGCLLESCNLCLTCLLQVNVAPFLLRICALSDAGILPSSVKKGLDGLPNFSRWSHATMAQPSVLSVWDPEQVVSRTADRIQKMKAHTNGAK
jgi:glutathione S-transferase